MNPAFAALELRTNLLTHVQAALGRKLLTVSAPAANQYRSFTPMMVAGHQQALLRAEPYFFSPDVCGVIEATAGNFPLDTWIGREELGYDYGFWVFATPLNVVRPEARRFGGIRAISWFVTYADEATRNDPNAESFLMVAGQGSSGIASHAHRVCLTFWLEDRGQRDLTQYCGMADAVPVTFLPWAFSESLHEALGDFDLGSAREWLDTRHHKAALFMAALTFLRQKLFDQRRHDITNRAMRRRACSVGIPLDPVQVVYLRRPDSLGVAPQGDGQAQWSHRWLVHGHWRNQPVGPGRRERRTTWIAPYVKGPSTAPLFVPERVFSVVR